MAYAKKGTECKICILSIFVFNKIKAVDKMLLIFKVVYYHRTFLFLHQRETINEILNWSICREQLAVGSQSNCVTHL